MALATNGEGKARLLADVAHIKGEGAQLRSDP